jgi:GMP synthase-like glutamine amidotransferase
MRNSPLAAAGERPAAAGSRHRPAKRIHSVLVLQNCPDEGIGLYGARLRKLGIHHRVVHAYAGEPIPPLEQCDAVIVGGTPLSVNAFRDHEFLIAEAGWLREALNLGKPILGICFGAQLLARLLGAEVKRNPVMEIGTYPVRLTAGGHSDPLFQGFPKAFPVFHWHGDTFDIPPWGLRLVAGWDCPNQGFRMGNAVGVQFHLEVTADEANRWAAAYADELQAAGKSRTRIARECREHEPLMAELAGRLLDNFLALPPAPAFGGG